MQQNYNIVNCSQRAADYIPMTFNSYLLPSFTQVAPHPPTLLPLATTNLFSYLWACFFLLDSTYKWDHMVFAFCLLISLSVMPSKSIHALANGKILLCLVAEKCSAGTVGGMTAGVLVPESIFVIVPLFCSLRDQPHGLLQTVLVLALKVPHPEEPLSPRQTRMASHPSGSPFSPPAQVLPHFKASGRSCLFSEGLPLLPSSLRGLLWHLQFLSCVFRGLCVRHTWMSSVLTGCLWRWVFSIVPRTTLGTQLVSKEES